MGHEVTIDEEIAQIQIGAPHVVILGAGASRAALPTGDANARTLPLMNDLANLPTVAALLKDVPPSENFEHLYSTLPSDPTNDDLRAELERAIHQYFSALELPQHATIYDHLVVALRPKDVIATFNWDPFLIQAVRRNKALSPDRYPKLVFLHGNVLAGFCAADNVVGTVGTRCATCKKPYEPSRLLYPVAQKDYTGNAMISAAWTFLRDSLKRAFMVTIFGYSAPASDASAIALLKAAWGTPDERQVEQFEIIDVRPPSDLRQSWDAFIHSHHYEVYDDFYSSFIANHPRRTGEAWWNQFADARFTTPNPLPRGASVEQLGDWLEPLLTAESNARRQTAE
jgi:hypothetical protein